MKQLKLFTVCVLVAAFSAAPLTLLAADSKDSKPADKKAKPYPLKTCVVTDEKLGEMGDPYVFVHEGQELKLCCKGCLSDFKKDPAKYVKKVDKAEKKPSKS